MVRERKLKLDQHFPFSFAVKASSPNKYPLPLSVFDSEEMTDHNLQAEPSTLH